MPGYILQDDPAFASRRLSIPFMEDEVDPPDENLGFANRYELLDAPGNLALRPRRKTAGFFCILKIPPGSRNLNRQMISIADREDLHI
jgi:hypothetical protein